MSDTLQPPEGDAPRAPLTPGSDPVPDCAPEEAYRRMFDCLPEAVLVIQDGAFRFSNRRAEALLGYSRAELRSGQLAAIVHPEALERVLRQATECPCSDGGTASACCTFKLVHPDGSVHWAEMRSEPFIWRDRAATLCSLRDITALRLSEETYRKIVTATSEGFMMLGADMRVTEVNPALLFMTGLAPEQLIGHPFDRMYAPESVEFYSASRDHMSFEAQLLTADGGKLPTLFKRSTLRDAAGESTGFLVFLTDITELKATQAELHRAEQRYRSMYRNAVQGMFQAELDGKLLRVNPAYARILGYDSAEEMLGLKNGSAGLYFDPGERQRMLKALKRRGVLANYEVKLRRRDGQPVWALANYRLTQEEGGRKIIEGMLVDHTRRKHLEEALRRGRERFRGLSMHDNLTRLYNTRYLYKALERLCRTCSASGKPLSLIFIDMDHFKRVVDTYGHLNGSLALREVARTFRSLLRSPCFGVAYGGDEFVLVLPGYDSARARAKVESIRRKMKTTVYLTASGLAVRLSASFGLATYPQDAADIRSLLARADQALFRVKQTAKGGIGTAS
jgi:diguanylate cyclase (GGDEF)-like protein/PAS domain S-box-containing protein